MALSPKLKIFHPLITESRFTPLTQQQANKLRDKLLGQGLRTVFTKLADQERQWTSVPKNHRSGVRIQAAFMLKKEGCGWLLQTSWCLNPLFLQLFTKVKT